MNKSKQLYCDLKDELVAYTPGSTFRTVRSIIDKSGLSQTTVCSAIQRLTEEGLLRKNGRRSMEVTDAVLRYRKGAKPVYCLAIPRWPSEYYNMVELCFMEQAERLGYELEIVHYDWKLRELRELGLPKLDGLVVMTGGGRTSPETASIFSTHGGALRDLRALPARSGAAFGQQ